MESVHGHLGLSQLVGCWRYLVSALACLLLFVLITGAAAKNRSYPSDRLPAGPSKTNKNFEKCIEKQPDIVQSRPLMRDRPGNNRWVSAGSEQALQTAHISIYNTQYLSLHLS
jgi:hypothetical protein